MTKKYKFDRVIEGRNDNGRYHYDAEANPIMFNLIIYLYIIIGYLLIAVSLYLLSVLMFGVFKAAS